MSIFLKSIGAISLFAIGASAVSAQDQDYNKKQGLYIGTGIGLSQIRDGEFESNQAHLRSSRDLMQNFRLGYKWDNFRAELEYSTYNYDRLSFTNPTFGSGGGEADSDAAMVNVFYDLNLDSRLRPYMGVGYGKRRIELEDVSTAMGTYVDQTSSKKAYQGMFGTAYDISNSVALNLEYRFIQVRGKGTPFNIAEGLSDLEARAHSLVFGLNYYFGQKRAAPAPVVYLPEPSSEPAPVVVQEPAPAPEPVVEPVMKKIPHPITIYFDFDSSDLGDAANELIKIAAAQFTEHGELRVMIEGHTDSRGTKIYNEKLSNERAEAVKQALVSAGVPGRAIYVSSYGETRPLRKTEDGVKEPLNRRVELMFEKQ